MEEMKINLLGFTPIAEARGTLLASPVDNLVDCGLSIFRGVYDGNCNIGYLDVHFVRHKGVNRISKRFDELAILFPPACSNKEGHAVDQIWEGEEILLLPHGKMIEDSFKDAASKIEAYVKDYPKSYELHVLFKYYDKTFSIALLTK